MSRYTYLDPQDAYYRRLAPAKNGEIVGHLVGRAYWVPRDEGAHRDFYTTDEQAAVYAFSLKVVIDVVPGPHAYSLVFADGTSEAFTSYDLLVLDTEDAPPFTIEQECFACRKVVALEVSPTGLARWKGGEHIQKALPELSAGERELLISGTCEPCFDAFTADPDEELDADDHAAMGRLGRKAFGS